MARKGGKPAKPDKAAKPDKPMPTEATKAKFREALERKHAHGGRDVSGDGEGSTIHGAHGPASTQRMFRRKSGG